MPAKTATKEYALRSAHHDGVDLGKAETAGNDPPNTGGGAGRGRCTYHLRFQLVHIRHHRDVRPAVPDIGWLQKMVTP
jgi:hypothetical protein